MDEHGSVVAGGAGPDTVFRVPESARLTRSAGYTVRLAALLSDGTELRAVSVRVRGR